MNHVEVFLQADFMLGLIQRRHPHGQKDIQTAYYEIILELRTSHPSIWLVQSTIHPNCFMLYYPPLIAHFRQIHDSKIGIIDFQEVDQ